MKAEVVNEDDKIMVVVPCAICGERAEGRVARSRRDENAAMNIAKQWASEINEGKTTLLCSKCMSKIPT